MAEPASNRPLQIFLCHAEEDKEVVWRLYDKLAAEGAEVWLDKRSILPGQTWEKAIRGAVKKSDVVLVCLSRKFNQKGFRQKEVKWALDEADLMVDGEIYIIPVRLEECSVPETLSNRQWVDLFAEGGDFNRANYDLLLRALREKAKMEGATLVRKSAFFSLPKPKPKLPVPVKKTGAKPPPEPAKKAAEPAPAAILPDDNPALATEAQPVPEKLSKPKRKWNPTILAALIGAFATIFAAVLGFPPLAKWAEHAFAPTATLHIPTAAITLTIEPTNTAVVIAPTLTTRPSQTPTPTYTPTATPYPPEITQKGAKMALVPAGTFTMGNTADQALAECKKYRSDCQRDWFLNEEPPHTVDLPAFYMDVYEVTNALYKACVEAGGCSQPQDTGKYNNSQYADHPVVSVDWNQAKTYCEWRGARLPTEAEWEKAARGTDTKTYPWGEGIGCDQANYSGCKGDTMPVGSYEKGQSPYGLYDMAGNVWEWVADWYSETYYQNSPGFNPPGPDTGDYHVLRGGSWYYNVPYFLRVSNRNRRSPDLRGYSFGFRCARSAASRRGLTFPKGFSQKSASHHV